MTPTHRLGRFLRLMLAAAAMLSAAAMLPTSALAQSAGVALVIGVDRYAGRPSDGVCGATATALRAQLRSRHLTVELLVDPDRVEMQTAIGDYAAQLAGAPSGAALIYVCAAAAVDGTRLFLLPADTDPAAVELQTQGIILQAPMNALSGTGGTLYADLRLMAGTSHFALQSLGTRLPLGLHAVIATGGSPGAIGQRLASGAVDPVASWSATAAALAAGPGLQPSASIAYLPGLPAPSSSKPAAAAPPSSKPAAPAAPSSGPPSSGPPEPANAQAPPAATASSPVTQTGHTQDETSADRHAGGDGARQQAAKPARERSRRTDSADRRRTGHGADSPRIVRLQTALAHAGFYHGTPTGQLDPETIGGIRAFQLKLGDPPTGVMTGVEIVRLLNS